MWLDNPYPRQRLFIEPRCYTFVGTVVAVAGLGLGAASAAGAFAPSVTVPNTAKEAEQMQALEAEYLPALLGIQAASQEGGTFTLPPDIAAALEKQGVALSGSGASSDLAALQAQLKNTPRTIPKTTINRYGGTETIQMPNPAYAALEQQIKTQEKTPSGNTVSFAGQGTADVQGQIEKALAQGQLELGQKYDPQFIAQALKEEQQANPQQFAARQQLYNDIQGEINKPQVSPVSQTMENQVEERVNAGSGLTPEEQQMLQAAVTAGGNNVGGSGSPDFSTDLTTGFAGEDRALSNAGAGADWLASGETPSDISYREQQQTLANLGSFISGQTPENQYRQVSGAGTSPTPVYDSGYSPSYNGQAATALGQTAGANQYAENADLALQQANPWTAGLSAVLGGTKALANAGVFGG